MIYIKIYNLQTGIFNIPNPGREMSSSNLSSSSNDELSSNPSKSSTVCDSTDTKPSLKSSKHTYNDLTNPKNLKCTTKTKMNSTS